MSKEIKKAEMALTDASKFPIESCRAKLARRYGEDAVALSGPCEGSNLADCVCQQLDRRWDEIGKRFAGSEEKVVRLASKLASSFMKKDDTAQCVEDLVKLKYEKTAATEIAGYLKAYAMDTAADEEVDTLMDEVDSEDEDDGFPGDDDGGSDEGGKEDAPFGGGSDDDSDDDDEVSEVTDDVGGSDDSAGEPPMGDMGGDVGGMGDMGGGEEMVTFEIPRSVAEELHEVIKTQLGDGGMPGEGMPGEGMHGDGMPGAGAMAIEVVDDVGAPPAAPAPAGPEVPGEPTDMQMPGEQVVTSTETEMAAAPMGAPAPAPAKPMAPAAPPMAPATQQASGACCASTEQQTKEAGLMRAGRLQRIGQTILKLGPEMSINNTDQLAGHDGKQLGKAKEVKIETPKALEDGNVKAEGYTAGDSKFQDGGTMGKEEKFKAKTVSKDEVSGGQSSLLGKDESYPEGGPSIPAGSKPIGGETWEGGDVSTKGTVIATFRPDGLLVEAGGKKFLAKASIKSVPKELAEAIGKIKFDGDGKKFAREALKLIKSADCGVENCTHTDTSKLEAEKFSNDGEKKPEEGGAMVGKGKGSSKKDEGVVKIDTSKLEAEKFTNDGEKKPEGGKKASSEKETKVAGDKELPKPKAVGDNMEPEGYTGGKKEVQDGGTMGKEEKFSPETVKKEDFTGDSLMGKDESKDFEKPKVPAGNESNVTLINYKGTTSASSDQSQKRDLDEMEKRLRAEADVREARLVAASVYVADLLRHGDITTDQYASELEKIRSLPVQAIQALARSTSEMRTKQAAKFAARAGTETRSAGLGVPIVLPTSSTEKSLKDRLVEQFKLTKRFNDLEGK